MKARTVAAAAVTAISLGAVAAPTPAAAGPTCEGYKGVANHGEHVIEDYVLGAVIGGPDVETWPPSGELGEVLAGNGGAALPGGPGAGYHLLVGAPPGASFCVSAHSGDR
jgi:hypothetical protein